MRILVILITVATIGCSRPIIVICPVSVVSPQPCNYSCSGSVPQTWTWPHDRIILDPGETLQFKLNNGNDFTIPGSPEPKK